MNFEAKSRQKHNGKYESVSAKQTFVNYVLKVYTKLVSM